MQTFFSTKKKSRKKVKIALVFFVFLFVACVDDSSLSPESTIASQCALDIWNGHSPSRISFGANGEVYVLDDFSVVYRYKRDPSRLCAFELDREFGSYGELRLGGFAEEINYYGNSLFYHDGISLKKAEEETFECTNAEMTFDIAQGNIFSGSNSGLSLYNLTSSSCNKTSINFPGALQILALSASSDKVATIETVTSSIENPERLVVYSTENSSTPFRHALSDIETSELYFCSATRLRYFNSGILLFDKKCNRLGVFDREGYFVNSLDLADLGVRSPVDMDVFENEVYFLTETSFYLAYRLDLADLLR